MDYKADRIMDYTVYSLPPGKNKYEAVFDIPMKQLQLNGTRCSAWIVCSARCLSFFDPYTIILYFYLCLRTSRAVVLKSGGRLAPSGVGQNVLQFVHLLHFVLKL